MKKTIALLLSLFATCIISYADSGIFNGVMLIGSNDKDFDLKTVEGISGTINYNVELYTDGTDKQYCLRFAFDESKHFFMIPTHATLLMKTTKGDVVELRAMYAYDDPSSDKVGYAYFPISEEQLSMITEDGIIKFRIQTIVSTDHRSTYSEREWKTYSSGRGPSHQRGKQSSGSQTVMGNSIKKMVEDVDREWEKKKSSYLSSQKDVRSDF